MNYFWNQVIDVNKRMKYALLSDVCICVGACDQYDSMYCTAQVCAVHVHSGAVCVCACDV